MRMVDPLARELRELIAHGCPVNQDRLRVVLEGLLRRLGDVSSAPMFNAREEVMAVLRARRAGVAVDDQTPFQDLVQDEIDALLSRAGIEALDRLVERCKKKPLPRRRGRPSLKSEEERRQDRFAARSQARPATAPPLRSKA